MRVLYCNLPYKKRKLKKAENDIDISYFIKNEEEKIVAFYIVKLLWGFNTLLKILKILYFVSTPRILPNMSFILFFILFFDSPLSFFFFFFF